MLRNNQSTKTLAENEAAMSYEMNSVMSILHLCRRPVSRVQVRQKLMEAQRSDWIQSMNSNLAVQNSSDVNIMAGFDAMALQLDYYQAYHANIQYAPN